MLDKYKELEIEVFQVKFTLQELLDALRNDWSIILIDGPRLCFGYYFSDFIIDDLTSEQEDILRSKLKEILLLNTEEIKDRIEVNPDSVNYYFNYDLESGESNDWEIDVDCDHWFTPEENTLTLSLNKFLELIIGSKYEEVDPIMDEKIFKVLSEV